MKKTLSVLLFLCLNISYSQNTVGTISLTNDAFEAYTLFSINTDSYLINNCGEVINEWNSNYLQGNAVYLLPNGNLLRAGKLSSSNTNVTIGGIGGIIELFNWQGDLIWSYIYSGENFSHHHDVYPLPNGNILILAITIMTQEEAIQAGRNPALLESNELYNEQIIEVEPVGTNQANIVWEWNIKDHLIQDFDVTKDNFGSVEDNPQLLDINYLNSISSINNWLHINSIQYDETRDQIVLSSRKLSELWIIDHSTTTTEAASSSGGNSGKGGDLLYRWGNPEAYRQGTPSDRKLFGQHYPHYIEAGLPNENKIIIFNNGFQRTPSYSQVDIISPPETNLGIYDYVPGTAFAPTNTFYTYSELESESSTFYSDIVSSAQQLPNGNILICQGRQGYVFEIDSNENKVWEYVNPVNNTDGEIANQTEDPPAANLTFRAVKYTPDFPAFIGRDLTPDSPIEGNPDLTPCLNLSTEAFSYNDFKVYPNPTKDIITIDSPTILTNVEVFDISGNKLLESKSNKIDLSQFSNGIYFVKIMSNASSQTKKIIRI